MSLCGQCGCCHDRVVLVVDCWWSVNISLRMGIFEAQDGTAVGLS